MLTLLPCLGLGSLGTFLMALGHLCLSLGLSCFVKAALTGEALAASSVSSFHDPLSKPGVQTRMSAPPAVRFAKLTCFMMSPL